MKNEEVKNEIKGLLKELSDALELEQQDAAQNEPELLENEAEIKEFCKKQVERTQDGSSQCFILISRGERSTQQALLGSKIALIATLSSAMKTNPDLKSVLKLSLAISEKL